MAKNHKFHLVNRATIAAAAFLLAGCEVGSSTHPLSPFRAPSSTGTQVVPSTGSAEVGSTISVSVKVNDKNGNGIPNIIPSVTAINSTTNNSIGVTSGGCTASSILGVSVCTLRATAAGVYTVQTTAPVVATTSSKVTFFQVPRKISFITSPSSPSVSQTAFTTQPVVEVVDAVGAAVAGGKTAGTAGTGVITMSASGTAAGTLAGTVTATADATTGVASFVGLNIDAAGTYTLTASLTDTVAGTVTGTFSGLVINAGAGVGFKFTTSPTSSVSTNQVFPLQPVVAEVDAFGNTVNTDSSCVVNLTLAAAAGNAIDVGDELLGNNLSKTTTNGVSDFSGLNLKVVRTGATNSTLNYVLVATGSGSCLGAVTGAPFKSTAFAVTLAGVPSQLSVQTPPGTSSLNMVWTQQPVVAVLDNTGTIVATDNTTSVVMSVKPASGSPAGVISGSTSIQVVNGQAAFSGLSIPATTLQAGFAGPYTYLFQGFNAPHTIASATATQFINANGLTPAGLVFHVQPASAAINQSMAEIQVETVDASGYYCANDNSTSVTLGFYSGTGLMTATSPVTVVNGIARFENTSFSTSGVKQVDASAAGMATVYSSTFVINSYSTVQDHLALVRPPIAGAGTGGSVFAQQPWVAVEDSANNIITSDNSTVVTIDCALPITCPGNMIGQLNVKAVNGIAKFTNLAAPSSANNTNVELKATTTTETLPVAPTFSNQFAD
ncbi:MAG: hypothetical protein ACXWR4_04415 [Bdellovibrionota bacterium]